MGIAADLRQKGLRVSSKADRVLVGPPEFLTDSDRAFIRTHRATLLAELESESRQRLTSVTNAHAAAAPLLDEFGHALASGKLVICANCKQFDFGDDVAGPGKCRRYVEPTLPFVPFSCSAFDATTMSCKEM